MTGVPRRSVHGRGRRSLELLVLGNVSWEFEARIFPKAERNVPLPLNNLQLRIPGLAMPSNGMTFQTDIEVTFTQMMGVPGTLLALEESSEKDL